MAETRDNEQVGPHDAGPTGGDWSPIIPDPVDGSGPKPYVEVFDINRPSLGAIIARYIIGGSLLAVVVCVAAWLCAAILSTMPHIQ
jgi:hypothetical protein